MCVTAASVLPPGRYEMTERQFKKFRQATLYNVEKQKKKDNFTFLNQTVCKTGQMVLAGDSITELFNMELWDAYREQTGCIVYNRGISGDTSDRLLERFDENVLALKPKTVVLLIGINDLTAGADPAYVAENVRLLLERLQREMQQAHIILEAVYPVNPAMNQNRRLRKSAAKITELNHLLKKLAADCGAEFLDLTANLADASGCFRKELTYDGLHPNARGFAIIARQLYASLLHES